MIRPEDRVEPFRLALQRLSIAGLQAMAVKYKKRTGDDRTKDDFVRTLMTTLSPAQKKEAMQQFLLAGRGSMSIQQFIGDTHFDAKPNFDQAGTIPKIVTIGKSGDVHEGLRHIQWALVIGQNAYLDIELSLNVDKEADVVDTFYDDESQMLQIRSNYAVAKKITAAWAAIHEIDPGTQLKPVGIRNIEECHEFAHYIGGSIRRATGRKVVSKGFGKVMGEALPSIADLRGTEDYKNFLNDVDVSDAVMHLKLEGQPIKLGFGFAGRSTVFGNGVDEAAYDHVYSMLKAFMKGR